MGAVRRSDPWPAPWVTLVCDRAQMAAAPPQESWRDRSGKEPHCRDPVLPRLAMWGAIPAIPDASPDAAAAAAASTGPDLYDPAPPICSAAALRPRSAEANLGQGRCL